MTVIDYPNSLIFKEILEIFSKSEISQISTSNPRERIINLKLVYVCLKGIYKEKFTTEPFKLLLIDLYDKYVRRSVIYILQQLMSYLSELLIELEILNPKSEESLNSLMNLCQNVKLLKIFDIASYALKLYKFENIDGTYHSQRDKDIIIIGQIMHNTYKKIAAFYIESGLIRMNPDASILEGLLSTMHKAEKTFHHSVTEFISNFSDCIPILNYFENLYIVGSEYLFFYGTRLIDYEKLNEPNYLQMLESSVVFMTLKDGEKKLLINAINSCSSVIENFGYHSEVTCYLFFKVYFFDDRTQHGHYFHLKRLSLFNISDKIIVILIAGISCRLRVTSWQSAVL